jgi:hypothetical protein
VHDIIWPEKAPVCPTLTCRKVLGVAYFSIKRWAEQQGAASDAPLSLSTMKKSTSVARFKSSDTIYTPHGLGIAYSNSNLTDKAARYIIDNDPDAKTLFSELPPDGEDEDEQQLTPAQQSAEKALEKAEAPAQHVPAGFDYAKLASAMVDELERRSSEARNTQFEQDLDNARAQQPALTASTGGAADGGQETDNTDNSDSNTDTSDNSDTEDHDEAKPASLSRANKEQLQGLYRAELGQEPAVELTNDDLRNAIAEKRASLQDAK